MSTRSLRRYLISERCYKMGKKENSGSEPQTIKAKTGKVSIGKEAASVGIVVSRKSLTIGQADKLFVGARMEAEITATDPAQKRFENMPSARIKSVADVGRLSSGVDEYSATLSFKVSEISVEDFSRLSQEEVTLIVQRIGDAEKPSRGRPAKEDADAEE